MRSPSRKDTKGSQGALALVVKGGAGQVGAPEAQPPLTHLRRQWLHVSKVSVILTPESPLPSAVHSICMSETALDSDQRL